MNLFSIVELYRVCGRPQYESSCFSGKVDLEKYKTVIDRVRNSDQHGRFEEIEVDGSSLLDDEEIPNSGELYFKYKVIGSSNKTFHKNIASFISSSDDVSLGNWPEQYYLVEDDYFYPNDEEPEKISKLKSVCELSSYLSKLAHYHDKKDKFRLVYISPSSDEIMPPVVIESKINPCLLESIKDINLDVGILHDLVNVAEEDPHQSAKYAVFISSLADFSKYQNESPVFDYLVISWESFVSLYNNNLATYLSGFAFHKAKREVAEAEFGVAEQLSKVFSDVASKLFAVPVSFAAVLAIAKSTKSLEGAVILGGLFIFSLVTSGALWNQYRYLERVAHAKNGPCK